jgi:hypothetical protein
MVQPKLHGDGCSEEEGEMFKAITVRAKQPYSRAAGQKLGEALVRDLGRQPDACWLFCAPGPDIPDFVAGTRDATGSESFVGCTTDGEISSAGFSTASAVLAGISADKMEFHVASVPNIGRNGDSAGKQLARALPADSRHVQVLSDGLTGNGSAIARGMTSVLGTSVPISGGAAGDNRQFKQTLQFIGNKIVSDSAVAIAMSGDLYGGTGVKSGWTPVEMPRKVTKAMGNVVYEFDGEPALSVYRRYFGPLADKLPAVGVQFPFGIVDDSLRLGEDPVLRAPMALNEQEGSVTFAGEVPEGVTMLLTSGGFADSLLDASADAARQAVSNLAGGEPAMVFVYSCMARKILLGIRTGEETERIAEVVGAKVAMTGFYTYGEYCPARRDTECQLHNETATVTVIGLPSTEL